MTTERSVCPQHDALLERLDALARGQESLREEMCSANEKIRERFDSVCNSLADARERLAAQNGYRKGTEKSGESMSKWGVAAISAGVAIFILIINLLAARLLR
jgi:Flp pilus assembly protein TadB